MATFRKRSGPKGKPVRTPVGQFWMNGNTQMVGHWVPVILFRLQNIS